MDLSDGDAQAATVSSVMDAFSNQGFKTESVDVHIAKDKVKIKFQVQRSPFTMIHLLLIHTSDQSFTAGINSSSQCQIFPFEMKLGY